MLFILRLSLSLYILLLCSVVKAADKDQAIEITINHSPWLPFEYQENGVSKGITVDIIQTILSEMGFVVKFKQYAFKRAVEDARSGKADAVFSVIKSAKREESFFFPEQPLVVIGWYLYFPKGKVVAFEKDLKALEGLRIGSNRGFAYPDYFMNSTLIQHKPVNSDIVNMKKTAAGRLDAFICDDVNCQLLIKENQLQDAFEIYRNTPLGLDEVFIAFSKKSTVVSQHPSLPSQFSEILAKLRQKGVIAKIKGKYGIVE